MSTPLTSPTPRWRPSPRVVDVCLPLVMAVQAVLGSIGESHPHEANHQIGGGHRVPAAPWPVYLLVAFSGLVLYWRRRYPMPTLVASLAAVLLYTALGYVNGAALLNPAVALYYVASLARSPDPSKDIGSAQRVYVIAGTTMALLLVFTAAFNPFGAVRGTFPIVPAVFAVALFAGIAVANRRAYVDSISERAELAERTREEEALRRVSAERLRIARELHDVVAHTMSTINLQAGVAAHVNRDIPEQVASALSAIKDASKNGLRELRAILAVLRQVDESESTAPTPRLDDLDDLVATVCAAGLPTKVVVTGDARQLPATVELAAYRIAQESLTNTLRHAGPAEAVVRLAYRDDRLDVEVTDTGMGPTASRDSGGSGHGLIGMRERASAVGGTLHTGPGPHGGFQVNASLPLGSAS